MIQATEQLSGFRCVTHLYVRIATERPERSRRTELIKWKCFTNTLIWIESGYLWRIFKFQN